MKHLTLPKNTSGKDFIVGDLHGCYDDLMTALDLIKFDFKNDRLFSVGDLIDRGKDSMKCLNLIYEDWFYAVLGNHEHMMVESIVDQNRSSFQCWVQNGGCWHFNESEEELKCIALDLKELPRVITVEHKFHIVHAEITKRVLNMEIYHYDRIPVSDMTLFHWDFSEESEMDMLWGRDLIKACYDYPKKAELFQKDLMTTFCGHTQVSDVVKLGSQIYIDTGAYEYYTKNVESVLTIAEPDAGMLHQYSIKNKTISSKKFEMMVDSKI